VRLRGAFFATGGGEGRRWRDEEKEGFSGVEKTDGDPNAPPNNNYPPLKMYAVMCTLYVYLHIICLYSLM